MNQNTIYHLHWIAAICFWISGILHVIGDNKGIGCANICLGCAFFCFAMNDRKKK